MKCPTCKNTLIHIPTQEEDGTIKKIWMHPVTAVKCETSGDGIQVNITDERLMNVYQEFIKEKGISEELASEKHFPTLAEGIIHEKVEEKVSNEDVIKERLSDGLITLNEYDEIKKRLEN